MEFSHQLGLLINLKVFFYGHMFILAFYRFRLISQVRWATKEAATLNKSRMLAKLNKV